MFKERMVNAIVQCNQLPEEDIVILEYGLSKIFMLLEDTIFALILGYLMGIVVESIIFQVFYMLLRMYAGGYHADTERKCKIYSALVTVVSLTAIRFLPTRAWLFFLLALIASIVVAVLSPVEAVNKPLSGVEWIIYHRRTVIIVVVADLILLYSMILGNDTFYKPIVVGLFIICFLMIIGDRSNNRSHEVEISKEK